MDFSVHIICSEDVNFIIVLLCSIANRGQTIGNYVERHGIYVTFLPMYTQEAERIWAWIKQSRDMEQERGEE